MHTPNEASPPSSAASLSGTSPFGRLFNRSLLTTLLFLAPLKFGLVIGTMETPIFPRTLIEWLLTSWPPWFLAPLAGGALLLTVLTMPHRPSSASLRWASASWWVLLLGTLPGLLHTTEWDMAQQFLWHLIGAVCLAEAVKRTVTADPRAVVFLLAAICAGGLIAAYGAWNQVVFGGFDRLLATLSEQNMHAPHQVVANVRQGRAFGPFIYPNSLAAHLLLVGPPVIVALWCAGRHFSPQHTSKPLFAGVGALIILGALLLTRSRAALLALGAASAVHLMLTPALGRLRWALLPALFATGLALVVLINSGRSLSSLEARGHYYRGAVEMAIEQPVFGVGLGEFFPWYMRVKTPDAEPTRRPHNLILGFTAQSGLFGGLAAVLFCTLPLCLFHVRQRTAHNASTADNLPLVRAAELGLAAWLLHALLDFNIHIPGTVTTAAALPLLLIAHEARKQSPPPSALSPGRARGKNILLVAIALLALGGLWRWPGENAYARLVQGIKANTPVPALRPLAEEAARKQPFSPYPCWIWGLHLQRREHHEEAATALVEATNRAPHRAPFHAAATRSLAAIGETQQARQHAKLADRWSSSPAFGLPPEGEPPIKAGLSKPAPGGTETTP